MKNHLFYGLLLFFAFILFFACADNKQPHVQMSDAEEEISVTGSIFINDLREQICVAKLQKNEQELTWLYSKIASGYIMEQKTERGRLYLDSANLYFEDIKDDKYKAFYYHIYGDYFNSKMNDSLSHKYYYKAKELYKESDVNIIPVLFNLSVSYINRNDTISLKESVDKMLRISGSQNNKMNLAFSYKAAYYYYACLDQQRTPIDKNMLDQALYYAHKAVNILEEDSSLKDSQLTAYDFFTIADIMLRKENTNMDSMKYYVDRAKEYSLPNDTVMLLNLLGLKAQYEYHTNELDSCITTCQEQLSLLGEWSIATTDLSVLFDVYTLLVEVSIKQDDYKTALQYEKLRHGYQDKLQNVEKFKIIEELRKKYKAEQKNREIKTGKRINYLLTGICLILIMLAYFIWKWYKIKKENTEISLKLLEEDYMRLERKYTIRKIEAENVEHKWRQTEIDKLSQGITLKEAQIEVNRLRKLERSYGQEDRSWQLRETGTMLMEVTDSLIYPLQRYIDRIDMLKNHYVERLKRKELTDGQVLYCIAFVIKMDVGDIATCFEIRIDSVKKIKNKIKFDLAVEANISLEEYLNNLTLDKPNENLM